MQKLTDSSKQKILRNELKEDIDDISLGNSPSIFYKRKSNNGNRRLYFQRRRNIIGATH